MGVSGSLITVIQTLATILTILVIVDVIVSYFLSPYHPIRNMLDRIVQPMLNPIRRVVPMIGMFDFSSLVLLILIQLVATILTNILLGI